MDKPTRLPFVVHVDDVDDPCEIIDSVVAGGFAAGAYRVARSVWLNRVREDAPLLPEGVEPLLEAHQSGQTSRLALGDGWALRAIRWSDASAKLTVTARSAVLAREVLDAASRGAVDPEPEEGTSVEIGFWHLAGREARRSARSLDVEPWADIRANYSAPVSSALDRLMAAESPGRHGRLLLLHGAPGTGKTTVLRALAYAWRAWCRVDSVLDPDRLFKETSYLMGVVFKEDDDDEDDSAKWRLLVLEDCDELIRSEAKKETGQGLARLLNLTDGLVGQGLKVLVCITTNEELSRLHPAITRPGRCLAQVHVAPLTRAEAIAWLGRRDGVGPNGATLAELYARRGDIGKLGGDDVTGHDGLYL